MENKMAKEKAKFLNFGSLLEKEDGSLYIKLDKGIKSVTVEAEDYNGNDISGTLVSKDGKIFLNAQTPEERIEWQHKMEYIDRKTADERIKNVPDFVQLEITTKVE
jgi:hypothetical protein